MGPIDPFAKIGQFFPSAPRPTRRPDLKSRALFTLLALVIYLLMATTLIYPLTQAVGPGLPPLIAVVFASARGTLAQLGIGPIVTAGLIMQILVGAKLLNIDLSDPEGRRKFTTAQRGLAVVIAAVEALGFSLSYTQFNIYLRIAIFLQLLMGAFILIILDETIQKGWGIGSGVSLFILAGVARTIFWDIFSPLAAQEAGGQVYGFVPYVIDSLMKGTFSFNALWLRVATTPAGTTFLPSLTGLIGVIIITLLLVYLQSMRIYIPITLPRYGGIKSRVPLQFLYVANIPVLLVGILFSNIILFNRLASAYSVPYLSSFLRTLAFYMSPPRHGYELLINPARVLIYAGLLFALGILFGFMWIEVSGLSPSGQAEQLIKSGLEIPGVRRNPKILESLLAKYIYPLTLISSIIVCAISLFADLLGTYGGGIGILLAVGIIQQYYTMIAYEQALEMYPLLKRFIGEE